MKILVLIFSLLFSVTAYAQSIEEKLVKEIWGEIDTHSGKHRGKAGLIIMNFNADFTFESYETTCTSDNVLQKGTWSLQSDTLSLSNVITKNYKEESTRMGKLVPIKNSASIIYRIKKLKDKSLLFENESGTNDFSFKTLRVNYIPQE